MPGPCPTMPILCYNSSFKDSNSANAAELLSSSEIIRQGPLSRFVGSSGRWLDVHAVLTRAGYLHLLPPSAVEAAADATRAAAAAEAEPEPEPEATNAKGKSSPPRPSSRLLPSASLLPADTLALARCDLEAADATTLQLVEAHSGASLGGGGGGGMLSLVFGARPGRCVVLRGDAACEWAIVIRESISLLKK